MAPSLFPPQVVDSSLVVLVEKLSSFIRNQNINRNQLQPQYRRPYSFTLGPSKVSPWLKNLVSTANLLPRYSVAFCESAAFSPAPISQSSLQQQLSDFCEKYSIPRDCRPVWTKQGGTFHICL